MHVERDEVGEKELVNYSYHKRDAKGRGPGGQLAALGEECRGIEK
jgi:hypothetical protein